MWRCVGVVGLLMLIAGCQTTHEDLIAKGYPPAFADGFDDGCSSGRQAAGAITGEFRKKRSALPQGQAVRRGLERWLPSVSGDARKARTVRTIAATIGTTGTKAWQQQKDQDAARAFSLAISR